MKLTKNQIANINNDGTDYRQIALKLQSDIEQLKQEQANTDSSFLKEIRERLFKYSTSKDITQFEMACQMIDDWIIELEKTMNK